MKLVVRLLITLLASLLGWIGFTGSAASGATPGEVPLVHAYTYDRSSHSAGLSAGNTERAPPAVAYDYTQRHGAADATSYGPSGRPRPVRASSYATYDQPVQLQRRDSARVTTTTAPSGRMANVFALPRVCVAAKSGTELRKVGSVLETVDDVMANPALLKGRHPALVETILKDTPGWQVEKLGRGSQAGRGWVFRQCTPAGNPTVQQLRWHPGGGHHGPDPYWRVVGPNGDLGGIIR